MITRTYSFPFEDKVKTNSKDEALNWVEKMKEAIIKELDKDPFANVTIGAKITVQSERIKLNEIPLLDDAEIHRINKILQIVVARYGGYMSTPKSVTELIEDTRDIVGKLALKRLQHEATLLHEAISDLREQQMNEVPPKVAG